MSIPRLFVCATFVVVSALAGQDQTSANAAIPDKVIDQVLRREPDRHLFLAEGQRPSRVCSVPLLEWAPPKDKEYKLRILPLPKESASKDVLPLEATPAPPCPKD